MKQQESYIESDVQNIYDEQVGLWISHVYYRQFQGRIRYFEGANLIMMQPKMFKAIFFQIHDKGITEIRSYKKYLNLNHQSQIIPTESNNLILISRKNEVLDIIDVNRMETLTTIKLNCSQSQQGFQFSNQQTIFIIDQLQGQIRSFCLLRSKFIIKFQFRWFIQIKDPQFSRYQMHLQSYDSIYILNNKTFKIISRQEKNKIIINRITEILVPNHNAFQKIDLLKIPSISQLRNISYNFIQWLYIDTLKFWCILQNDYLSIFNKNYQLLQQIVIKMSYQPINMQYDSQGLKIFYTKKRKY